MKITSNIQTGTKVMNKLTGKEYVIIDKYNGEKAVAEWEDKETGEVERVEITAHNDICYRVTSYAPDRTIYDFDVKDGILEYYGEPVTEQGKWKFERIISSQPGVVILATPANEETKAVQIVAYEVARNHFEQVCTIPEGFKKETETSETVLLSYVVPKTVKVKEDGGEVEKVVLDKAGVILVSGTEMYFFPINAPFDILPVKSMETNGKVVAIVSTQDAEFKAKKPEYTMLLLAKRPQISGQTRRLPAPAERISLTKWGAYPTFIGNDFVDVVNETYHVAGAAELPIFYVDSAYPDDYTREMFFTNEKQAKIVKVTAKRTKDRGTLTEISEY